MMISFLPILVIVLLLIPLSLIALARWMNADTSKDPERRRILDMVESGKVSSDEGAELLDAMGKSSALRGQDKFSRPDIVLLVGLALVILGFFLPCNRINNRMFQTGSQIGAQGWAILVIALLAAIPVFVTPRSALYKMCMLQIFLSIIGLALIVSLLIRTGDRFGYGLIFCLLGFIIAAYASIIKLKKLAA